VGLSTEEAVGVNRSGHQHQSALKNIFKADAVFRSITILPMQAGGSAGASEGEGVGGRLGVGILGGIPG
jgi:hypothetical protein